MLAQQNKPTQFSHLDLYRYVIAQDPVINNMIFLSLLLNLGEANTPDPSTYRCLFQAMISDWRYKWYEGSGQQTNPYFPFGFVQVCCVEEQYLLESLQMLNTSMFACSSYTILHFTCTCVLCMASFPPLHNK